MFTCSDIHICSSLSNDRLTFSVNDFKNIGIKTRSQQIEHLTYYIEYTKYDFDKGLQRRNKNKRKNMHMILHNNIWTKNIYLILSH